MEIIYKVDGKEFTDKAEAQEYENGIAVKSAKFRVGDRVYFFENDRIVTTEVTEVAVAINKVLLYGLKGFKAKRMETRLYGSLDECFEHLKSTIEDFSGEND